MIKDVRHEVRAGQAVLLRPGETHAVLCEQSSPMKLLDIKFSVLDPELLQTVNSLDTFLSVADFSWYLQCFEKILWESQAHLPHYYPLICGYLYDLLVHLERERGVEPLAAPEIITLPEQLPTGKYHGVDVAALMQYINFNYSNIITLDHLAEAANINKTTLTSLFKELYGTTPIRYVNRLRMQKAKELLCNTDTCISEIAELVGFQSIHYFCRYFKSKENCTPMEYRMRNSKSCYFSFE